MRFFTRFQKKRLKKLLYFTLSILLIANFTSGCESNKSDLKIGLVGGLTGRHSDLGVYGRNGVILAMEEINKKGGIDGQKIILIPKDDKQNPEIAKKVVRELIAEDVSAIIGHFTSTMTMATVNMINEAKILMISPTTSTNKLTGIDDYFIRMMSPNKAAIKSLADYTINKAGFRKIVVIYDVLNKSFSKEWYNTFKKHESVIPDLSIIPVPYTSSPEIRFSELATKVLEHKPDSVLIVSSALDAAMLCQQLKISDSSLHLFSTMWAMTDDFLKHSGPAGEGIIFANWFNKEYQSEKSLKFRKGYLERFGRPPNFASHFAYEAAQVLFTSLSNTQNSAELKNTILKTREFKGLQGNIVIDEFGDPLRKVFLMTVIKGQYVLLD